MSRFTAVALAFLFSCAAVAQTPAAFVDDYAKRHDFSGSILVARDGKVQIEKQFGDANRALRVPNGPRTKFWIASITKAFTAVLVLQLVDEGRLALDGTIADYLPDYAGAGARKITIHQLLNHTSGLPNFDQVKDAETALKSGLPNYQSPYTPDQLIAKFASGAPVAEPGTAFDYNNGDYVLLGRIVERVTGQSFDARLRERILAPLALAHTGMLKQYDVVPDLASTYFWRDDVKALANDLPVYPENWYAAGAMYATPRDVLAFSDALFDGRLVKPETLDKMTRPGLDDYGYGVWSFDMKAGERTVHVVKRPGRIMGAQAMLLRVIEPDVTVVLLANTSSADLDEFAAQIAKRIVVETFTSRESAAGTPR
ncbi:MAG TPA: serine hydrolase domain-containing protein [Tahibacter sp.]|nr:serine hydrolase domain-containing protein [Tahibacter sp.]